MEETGEDCSHHPRLELVDNLLSLLNFIDNYTLALNVLAFSLFFVFSAKINSPFLSKRNLTVKVFTLTSFPVVVGFVIVLDFIHKYIVFVLKPLWNDPAYTEVIGMYWYMSFAITDLIMVFLAVFLINKYALLRDKFSFVILAVYIVLAAIQSLNFFVTWVLNSLVIYNVYPVLIVTCNVFVSIIALSFLVRLILVRTSSVLLFLIRR